MELNTFSAREWYEAEWRVCEAPQDGQPTDCVKLAFRGLRVRVGMHTGLQDPGEILQNKVGNGLRATWCAMLAPRAFRPGG